MSEIEELLQRYENVVRLPWKHALSGPEKVWFAVYDPAQERRLRLRIPEFEVVTVNAEHGWVQVDLADAFAGWMAEHEYREAYFESPEDMDLALLEFTAYAVDLIQGKLTAPETDEDAVVAVFGVASLFGLTYASDVLEKVNPAIRGRLLVFFPGHRDGANYRLLDARDGWDYLAVPI